MLDFREKIVACISKHEINETRQIVYMSVIYRINIGRISFDTECVVVSGLIRYRFCLTYTEQIVLWYLGI